MSCDDAQQLRDYKLSIEYKYLVDHAPGGVFLLPTLDNNRLLHGVIFVRRGLYRDGVFRFTITLPLLYNSVGTFPIVKFTPPIFNPFIHEETGILKLMLSDWNDNDSSDANTDTITDNSNYSDNSSQHVASIAATGTGTCTDTSDWNPEKHFLATVVSYIKKIFYLKKDTLIAKWGAPPVPPAATATNPTNTTYVDSNDNANANADANANSHTIVYKMGSNIFPNENAYELFVNNTEHYYTIIKQVVKESIFTATIQSDIIATGGNITSTTDVNTSMTDTAATITATTTDTTDTTSHSINSHSHMFTFTEPYPVHSLLRKAILGKLTMEREAELQKRRDENKLLNSSTSTQGIKIAAELADEASVGLRNHDIDSAPNENEDAETELLALEVIFALQLNNNSGKSATSNADADADADADANADADVDANANADFDFGASAGASAFADDGSNTHTHSEKSMFATDLDVAAAVNGLGVAVGVGDSVGVGYDVTNDVEDEEDAAVEAAAVASATATAAALVK